VVQGRVSASDLEKFAAERGLPVAYAAPFYSAMLKHPQAGPLSALAGVDYRTFRAYVTSREEALRRTFDRLDHGALTIAIGFRQSALSLTALTTVRSL
jgi:hypothetical protein